jgi:hypothetical protein
MSDMPPNHHCPGCGTSLPANPRYPWHFCNACLDRATDGSGRSLDFSNVSLSGGLQYSYRGTGTWQKVGSVACLIHTRPVIVSEARFGGVVAHPLESAPMPDHHHNLIDLTR